MQVLLIVAFAGLLLRDQLGIVPPAYGRLSDGMILACSLAPFMVLALVVQVAAGLSGRAMDRHGSLDAVAMADRTLAVTRWSGVLLHLGNVLVLGWLDLVRRWVGDLVLVDELIAIAPLLGLLLSGWWSIYPIDRRLREATLIGNVDSGRPVETLLTRSQYMVLQVRHQVLLILAPMSFLIAWSESLRLGVERLLNAYDDGRLTLGSNTERLAAWLNDPSHLSWVFTGAQLAGVLLVMCLMPLAVGVIWNVSPLPAGPLRDRLLGLCRAARIRSGRLLIWRTRGTLVNGAVMGLVPPARCILLTDALLDQLPQEQVEAVMAHEIAHVRRRHMPWLMACMLASVGLSAGGGEWLIRALGWVGHTSESVQTAVIALTAASLTIGLVLFGFVSRRFEWQADAFAVQTLSRLDAPGERPLVASAAVAAMSGALVTVARLNHIPPGKFSWRHGSIARRLANLRDLEGQAVDGLPIDRVVARTKVLTALGAAAAVALMIWPPTLS